MSNQTTSDIPITGPEFEGGYDPTIGQVRGFKVDPQGQLYIANLGTISASGNLAVQGIVGGIPVPVVQAISVGASYTFSWDTSFGTQASHNSKNAPALLESVYVSSVYNLASYLQFFNSSVASGTPFLSFAIPAGSSTLPAVLVLDQEFFGNGAYFSSALSWGISTTNNTYTAATASNYTVNIGFF